MKIPKLGRKKGTSSKALETLPVLPDKYQFNVDNLKSDTLFQEMLSQTNQELESIGLEVTEQGNPFISLWAMELIIAGLATKTESLDLIAATFVEYDFSDVTSRKKNVQPTKKIIESYTITGIHVTEEIHVPKIIADYFMNLRADDVGFDGRVAYITDILGEYDRTYGTFFSKNYGLLPSESITLPSEQVWLAAYQKEASISVTSGTLKSNVVEEVEDTTHDINENKLEYAADTTTTEPNDEPIIEESIPAEITPVVESMTTYTETELNNDIASEIPADFSLSKNFGELEKYRVSAAIKPELYELNSSQTMNSSVNEKLAERKEEINAERRSVVNTLNTSAEQKLGKKIDFFKRQLEHVENEFDLTHDASKQAHDIVDPILLQEKKTVTQDRLNVIQQETQHAISEENQRHENAIGQITSAAKLAENELYVELNTEFEAKQSLRYEEVLSDVTMQLNGKKNNKIATMVSMFASELETLSAELLSASNAYVNDMIQDQHEELNEYQEFLQNEHSEEQLAAVKKYNVETFKARIATLEQELEGRLKDSQRQSEEIETLKDESERLKAELRGVRSNNLYVDDVTESTAKQVTEVQRENELKTASLLENERQKSKKRAMLSVLITTIILGSFIAGLGYVLYTDKQHMESEKSALVAENKDKDKELSKHKEQLESLSKSNESKKDKSMADTTSNVDFEALDNSLAVDDLSVYYKDFSNNELGDSEYRVFRVGQLLNQNGHRSAAEKVSKDNPKYNGQLRVYLGI